MVDIKTLPNEELERDLEDSLTDIRVCETSLLYGITKYSGGLVRERLDKNKQFVEVITAEIKRRKGEDSNE